MMDVMEYARLYSCPIVYRHEIVSIESKAIYNTTKIL